MAEEVSPLLTFSPVKLGMPAFDDTFLFNSIMLSSTDSVDVFMMVCVPSTVRSPTRRCSILPVEPFILKASVVVPSSLTVNMMSLFAVVCAIVKSSDDKLIVMSFPAPILIPSSVCTVNLPVVVSASSDLR